MVNMFIIDGLKPICDTSDNDVIIRTIEHIMNDSKLFNGFTNSFFTYQSLCKNDIMYRVWSPSIESFAKDTIENDSFRRRQTKEKDDVFIEELKSMFVNPEAFVDLFKYILGYYYTENLFKIYDNDRVWKTFYRDYYSKSIENTYNKTQAMNINYFSEKPIEDCITSAIMSFINTEKSNIKDSTEASRECICVIPFIKVSLPDGKRTKFSINEALGTIYSLCVPDSFRNIVEFNDFITKIFNKLTIKAIKEVLVHKILDDLKRPKNKNISKIINDISLCYVRNANYLNKYISEGIKTFCENSNKIKNRFINKVEIKRYIEKLDNSDEISFLDYRSVPCDQSKIREQISVLMAPYHVLNTKIGAIEPSVVEMCSNLTENEASKVNRFNKSELGSFDTENLGKILEKIMLNLVEINGMSSNSYIINNIRRTMSEIGLKSEYFTLVNEYQLMYIATVINNMIGCYLGDSPFGDDLEYTRNIWKLKYNENFCTYSSENEFMSAYLKRTGKYKSPIHTLFSIHNDLHKDAESINEYIYAKIFEDGTFADIHEKYPSELKSICNDITKYLSEVFKLIEETNELEKSLLTEYSKFYSRVHILAMCLAKVDPYMNIERNVYDIHNIINGNDFVDNF